MKVIWTEGAADDLEQIVDYIASNSPEAARRVASHIFETVTGLSSFPGLGRRRKTDSARELVFAPWPYICVYQVIEDAIHIKAIRHTSRNQRDVSYFT